MAPHGRSPNRGRGLIVAGTGGIALIGGAMFWTIIGPIIAIAIVIYWAVRIRDWTEEGRAIS